MKKFILIISAIAMTAIYTFAQEAATETVSPSENETAQKCPECEKRQAMKKARMEKRAAHRAAHKNACENGKCDKQEGKCGKKGECDKKGDCEKKDGKCQKQEGKCGKKGECEKKEGKCGKKDGKCDKKDCKKAEQQDSVPVEE